MSNESKDLEATVAKHLEQSPQQFIGQPITDVTKDLMVSYLRNWLEDLKIITRKPVYSLLDIEVRVEGNTVHGSLKPKSGLSDEDYRRASGFCGVENEQSNHL